MLSRLWQCCFYRLYLLAKLVLHGSATWTSETIHPLAQICRVLMTALKFRRARRFCLSATRRFCRLKLPRYHGSMRLVLAVTSCGCTPQNQDSFTNFRRRFLLLPLKLSCLNLPCFAPLSCLRNHFNFNRHFLNCSVSPCLIRKGHDCELVKPCYMNSSQALMSSGVSVRRPSHGGVSWEVFVLILRHSGPSHCLWPCHYVKEFDHVLTFSNQAVFRDSLHRTPSTWIFDDHWLSPIAAEVLVVIKSYQLDHPRSTIPIWRGSIRPTTADKLGHIKYVLIWFTGTMINQHNGGNFCGATLSGVMRYSMNELVLSQTLDVDASVPYSQESFCGLFNGVVSGYNAFVSFSMYLHLIYIYIYVCGHTWISQNSCLKRAYCPAGESATGSWIALNHLGAGWVEDEPGGAFGLWRSAWEQPEQLKQLQQPPCSTATLCTSLYLFMFLYPMDFDLRFFTNFRFTGPLDWNPIHLHPERPSQWIFTTRYDISMLLYYIILCRFVDHKYFCIDIQPSATHTYS